MSVEKYKVQNKNYIAKNLFGKIGLKIVSIGPIIGLALYLLLKEKKKCTRK